MNDEIGKKVFRKLLYFYENEIPVHFDLISNGWKNGKIKELNEERLTFILEENLEGELHFLCEEVDPDSIVKFKERGE